MPIETKYVCQKCNQEYAGSIQFCPVCNSPIYVNVTDTDADISSDDELQTKNINNNLSIPIKNDTHNTIDKWYGTYDNATGERNVLVQNVLIWIFIMAVGLLLLIGLVYGLITAFTKDTSQSKLKYNAWASATEFVESKLNNPRTADFSFYDEGYVTEKYDGTYEVVGYVDAENDFGVEKRIYFVVTLEKDGVTFTVEDYSLEEE